MPSSCQEAVVPVAPSPLLSPAGRGSWRPGRTSAVLRGRVTVGPGRGARSLPSNRREEPRAAGAERLRGDQAGGRGRIRPSRPPVRPQAQIPRKRGATVVCRGGRPGSVLNPCIISRPALRVPRPSWRSSATCCGTPAPRRCQAGDGASNREWGRGADAWPGVLRPLRAGACPRRRVNRTARFNQPARRFSFVSVFVGDESRTTFVMPYGDNADRSPPTT